MERVHSFTLLGTTVSAELTWSVSTKTDIKKAQRYLKGLRKNNVGQEPLGTRSAVDSILSSCPEAERQRLQRPVHTAQRIIG